MSRTLTNREGKANVTVIALTLNEASHLPEFIKHLEDWACDLFIVDSLSSDETVDIALHAGVRLVQRPFTNFGDQWNFAVRRLPIRTTWTLKLDPDERLSDALKRDIEKVMSDPAAKEGYAFPRRLWFMGRPLHVFQDVLRLWRTGKCRFSDVIVNEHPLIEGRVGRLNGVLEHLDSHDLYHWCEKQNRYTTMEAMIKYRGARLAVNPRLFGTPLERMMYAKRLFFQVPGRYAFLQLYHLLAQGAWRDGRVGRIWARLRTEVYRMIEAKYIEMVAIGRAPELPIASHGDFDRRILGSELQRQLLPETVMGE